MTEVRQLVFGAILFSAVITGLMNFASPFFDAYNIDNSENLTSFQVMNNITEKASQADNITSTNPFENPDPTSIFFGLSSQAISAVRVLASSGNVLLTVISDISTILHLPEWLTAAAFAILSIFMVLIVIRATLKLNV